jgi:hypothetical protein
MIGGTSFPFQIHPNETEPSVAIRKDGQDLLVTGNFFAGVSTLGGARFTFLDPTLTFQQPPGRLFHCDQAVIYDKARDLMLWYMQHHEDGQGHGNLIRLAVAAGDKIRIPRQYALYDVTPDRINKDWTNVLLDFPDIVLTKNYAYVTTNVFNQNIPEVADTSSPFKGAVTLRIALDDLKALKPLAFDVFTTVPPVKPPVGDQKQGFEAPLEFGHGGLRGTRSAIDQTALYIGTHADPDEAGVRDRILVYKWDESRTEVEAPREVRVGSFRGGPGTCTSAVGPEGFDWLSRADERMTAAWNTGKVIGFAWTSAPGTESNTPFTKPHVRVVVIDTETMSALAQPDLYSDQVAFAYAAMAPTQAGELGLSVAYGDGDIYPSVGVGFLAAAAKPEEYRWQLARVGTGDIGPTTDAAWGDYFWVCEDPTQAGAWVGVGFISKALSRSAHLNEVLVARYHRSTVVAAAPLPAPLPPARQAAPPSAIGQLQERIRNLEERSEVQSRQINALLQELDQMRRQRP